METARTARTDPESLRQPAALHLRLHEKAGKEEAILFIGSEYEPISRKDLLRIHERFAADPIGYLKETSPGMQIIVKGEDGQPMHPKNTPYNPIEKE